MSTRKCFSLALALIVLASVPACVQLTGQRIAWFHDTEKDELQILLYYDGIHDSGSDQHGKGVQQIPPFVQQGDIMLLDWLGRLDMVKVRQQSQDSQAKPLDREWAQLLLTLRAEAVGHYREPDGRIGVLQRITIPHVSEFVRKLNALISKSILDTAQPKDGPLVLTFARIRKAAEQGHTWVRLDGQAIHASVPVQSDEWAFVKAGVLLGSGEWAAKALGENATAEKKREFLRAIQALTAAPLSYIENDGQAEFVLGRSKSPSVLRLAIRDEHEPSLETTVRESVKLDLDQAMAKAVLQEKPQTPSSIGDALQWGPSEEKVRALLSAASGDDARLREAAIKQLATEASQWQRDHGVPAAPKAMADSTQYLADWKTWYAEMRKFPVRDLDGAKPKTE